MTSQSDNHEKRWQAIAAKLGVQGRVSGNLKALVETFAGISESALSHEACQALLPAYITAEMDGLDADTQYPDVKYHLDRCEECEAVYVELLSFEQTMAPLERGVVGELSAVDVRIKPSIAIKTWVQKIATEIANSFPRLQSRVQTAATRFFDQLQINGGEFLLSPQPHLGGAISPLSLMASTYTATVRLVRHLDGAVLNDPVALRIAIEEVARAEAHRQQIRTLDIEQFVAAYTTIVVNQPELLEELRSDNP